MMNEMNPGEERPLRMFALHGRFPDGFHIALVPAALSEEQMQAAFDELGIDVEAVLELGGWRTSSTSVAVVHVPFPGRD
jgi:hypothetical protein